MADRDVAVMERSSHYPVAELVLPQDPVLRNLAIRKFNGQNQVVYVPIPVTDVTLDAVQKAAPASRNQQEGLVARLLRFLSEADASQQQQAGSQTRGWGD